MWSLLILDFFIKVDLNSNFMWLKIFQWIFTILYKKIYVSDELFFKCTKLNNLWIKHCKWIFVTQSFISTMDQRKGFVNVSYIVTVVRNNFYAWDDIVAILCLNDDLSCQLFLKTFVMWYFKHIYDQLHQWFPIESRSHLWW